MKNRFYEFWNGHPRDIKEEATIICAARFDINLKWMNDAMIMKLIKSRIKSMYKQKYPNARRFKLKTGRRVK
jgi:hypothetical protein